EFSHFQPKNYWDARARGTGGSQTDPYCSCGEENLLGYPGDPYAAECILIHEFAHNMHLRGMVRVDPTFDTRLQAVYDRAMAAGLWKGKYASVNHHEYFAEGVQSWFDDNRENDHDHNHVNTRAELIEYDPGLAKMCEEVFGETELKYTKPATRLRDHLVGYDPSQTPEFVWPKHLQVEIEKIRATARARDKAANAKRPNVLFIAVDDLNDWIGCLGGHPQATTPNIDRLAASGMLFTNAYCAGASCNPSRTAVMTGLAPHHSGLYTNTQKMRDVLPETELMPKYFSRHGYWSGGAGKILHYIVDGDSWDEYFPSRQSENPFPRTFYPKQRPVNLPREPWMYMETDWGALEVTDEEFGGDWLVSKWVGEQLARKHEQPFFLACGIYRPHEPWFVPKKYFDGFPVEEIQMPLGLNEDDLDDIPPLGQALGTNRYLAHIQKHGQWRRGIQGYLASIAFADAMVGRVLDALEQGPNADDTIVVLWSDHGWHLGEKEHWQKFTGWRVCARVPLIVRVPPGVPGLAEGAKAATRCNRPVSLVDLFRTLTELAGLPPKEKIDGHSLAPLLSDPQAAWPHASLTHLDRPGNYAISTERWRYIHYFRGGEELYDIESDPHEWTNLAGKPAHAAKLAEMRVLTPDEMKPLPASP
ncbi:MAG: sulfatase-like hydrolase/transferase, partial [Planctomycetales bacterium]|nr:sulfatase-like hydrolase/transferase [Planctomycetales bacterium]